MIGDIRVQTRMSGTRLILMRLRFATTAPSARVRASFVISQPPSLWLPCVHLRGRRASRREMLRPLPPRARQRQEHVVQGWASQADVVDGDGSVLKLLKDQ